MPLKLFRLGTAAFPGWDGAGAAAQGGRWNPPGIPVIYTAGTLSLAMLERLVQRRNLGRTLLVEAEVPAELAVEDLMARPPPNWRALGSPEAVAGGGKMARIGSIPSSSGAISLGPAGGELFGQPSPPGCEPDQG